MQRVVVVFPFVPVMPTTGMRGAGVGASARLCRLIARSMPSAAHDATAATAAFTVSSTVFRSSARNSPST